MTVVTIAALIVLAWNVIRANADSKLLARLERFVPLPGTLRLALYIVVPAFVIQLLNLRVEVWYENGPPFDEWMKTLPIPVYDHRTENASVHALFSTVAFCCAIAQTLALAAIFAAMRHSSRAVSRTTVRCIVALLAVAALAAPAMATTDPYEYVATGILGFRSYAPPPGALAATVYAPYANEVHLKGVIYGPLWVLVDIAQTCLGPTVLAKLELLRITNALLVFALYALLRRAGVDRPTRTLFLLNPILWYYVVANGHAEAQGLALVLCAWLAATHRRPWLAAASLVAAGLIKLPFVLVGAPALLPIRSPWVRLAAWIGSAGIVAAVSSVATRGAMSSDLSHYVVRASADQHAKSLDGWLIVAPLVAVLALFLVASRRAFLGTAWLFAQTAPYAAAWYVLWGLPYAAVTGTLGVFIVIMPLACVLTDHTYNVVVPGIALVTAFGVVLALDAARSRRETPIARLAVDSPS